MSSATKEPLVSSTMDSYLLEVADAVNTTLDLNTLLQRVAEMLKRFIDYEIFAILLLNEKDAGAADPLPGGTSTGGGGTHTH